MDTNALKKFAQATRNLLIDQVTSKLDVVLAEGSAARREAPKAVKDLQSAIRKALGSRCVSLRKLCSGFGA